MRHDWTIGEIDEIYHSPLLGLLFRAQQITREFHAPDEVPSNWSFASPPRAGEGRAGPFPMSPQRQIFE